MCAAAHGTMGRCCAESPRRIALRHRAGRPDGPGRMAGVWPSGGDRPSRRGWPSRGSHRRADTLAPCTRSPVGRSTLPGFAARPTPTSASSAGRKSRSTSRAAASPGCCRTRREGFGVRVLVDGAWGFASSHRLDRGRGGPGRRRGRPDRPGQRDGAAPPRRPRRPPAGPRALRDPARRGSLRDSPGAEDRRPAGRRPGDEPGARASPSPTRPTAPSASGRRSRPATGA